MQIPFHAPFLQHNSLKKELLQATEKVLDSGLYILGKEVKSFEQNYATWNNVKHCVGVGNGLDALRIALQAAGVQPNNEVIIPAHTFIATALAVSQIGAKPVLVDIDHVTYNIDVTKIEQAITKSTKAIIPVHLYGQPCNMDFIMQIAEKYHLQIIEDNAQAQGATWNGQSAGSFGIANATSFYPIKNLGAIGDAGAITTNNDKIAEFVRQYSNYGTTERYQHDYEGINSRLDELQAAFLNVKLPYLTARNQQRQEKALFYIQSLLHVPEIILPITQQLATHVYHLFVIRTQKRNELQNFLAKNGIQTLIHYPVPIHLQKAYQHLGYQKGDFPVAEQVAETALSLPLYPELTSEQQAYIVQKIAVFFKN
jgi:dTDP-4-amino-4,6-dideoxygalactose transaminase